MKKTFALGMIIISVFTLSSCGLMKKNDRIYEIDEVVGNYVYETFTESAWYKDYHLDITEDFGTAYILTNSFERIRVGLDWERTDLFSGTLELTDTNITIAGRKGYITDGKITIEKITYSKIN